MLEEISKITLPPITSSDKSGGFITGEMTVGPSKISFKFSNHSTKYNISLTLSYSNATGNYFWHPIIKIGETKTYTISRRKIQKVTSISTHF